MKKLAIIGASELQNPLILRAKEMGLETHVFAWAAGDIGEKTADYFYPISIVERDAILSKCREIGIDGICTIASDLANVCVGYVAHAMGLSGNTPECVERTTNKHAMRACFEEHGCPSPKSHAVSKADFDADPQAAINLALKDMCFPLIVKPIDRSGSRGITKVENPKDVAEALSLSYEVGFGDIALVEEFAEGREFSIESCSWQGKHTILQITEKFTTGAPRFIEVGHLEPARVSKDEQARIREVTSQALDALGVTMGAGHTELKLAADGTIRLIEIGSRMGGDCIGSDLVSLSTGVDFIAAVIQCALGEAPTLEPQDGVYVYRNAAVKYVLSPDDVAVLEHVATDHPEWIRRKTDIAPFDHAVSDSSTRMGFAVLSFDEDFDGELLGLDN